MRMWKMFTFLSCFRLGLGDVTTDCILILFCIFCIYVLYYILSIYVLFLQAYDTIYIHYYRLTFVNIYV